MIKCIITSLNKTVDYENIQAITLQTTSGEVQILSGHVESFFLLQGGDISLFLSNGQKKLIKNVDGECYICDNQVIIIS